MAYVSSSFLVTKDVIMTVLLLLEIIYVFAFFLDFIRLYYLLKYFRFMSNLREVCILPINSTI